MNKNSLGATNSVNLWLPLATIDAGHIPVAFSTK